MTTEERLAECESALEAQRRDIEDQQRLTEGLQEQVAALVDVLKGTSVVLGTLQPLTQDE